VFFPNFRNPAAEIPRQRWVILLNPIAQEVAYPSVWFDNFRIILSSARFTKLSERLAFTQVFLREAFFKAFLLSLGFSLGVAFGFKRTIFTINGRSRSPTRQ
jgi:hypothetical protein